MQLLARTTDRLIYEPYYNCSYDAKYGFYNIENSTWYRRVKSKPEKNLPRIIRFK